MQASVRSLVSVCLLLLALSIRAKRELACNDTAWCDIPMPKASLFRFDPPTNLAQWRIARSQASSGEQVLLKLLKAIFPNQMDFLDGDELFRGLNAITDLHVDGNKDLTPLARKGTVSPPPKAKNYKWETISNATRANVVIPRDYDLQNLDRAPVVLLGYNAFARKGDNPYFTGPHVGEAIIERPHLYQYFNKIKNHVDKPFILLHGANENWGLFSTEFPNRTVDWGYCCKGEPMVHEILNHPKMLMFLHTQHHNLTHPKLVTIPRGIAISWDRKRSIIWELLHTADTTPKQSLVFTASSNWKHRPYIGRCIADKFITARDKSDVTMRSGRGGVRANAAAELEYYRKLVSARMSIALPGLGYDTFRLWESLTLGVVPVLEKGIGLDKTLWRLPALLVEDFDEVTPALLRTAYVEALYRANAGHFELERLTQSFWWTFVMNVSATMSQEAITAKFPPESEDSGFTRPWTPYHCGQAGELCGPGTKRTPRSSCGGKPANAN